MRDFWRGHVDEIPLALTEDVFGGDPCWPKLQAYFTLRVIPD